MTQSIFRFGTPMLMVLCALWMLTEFPSKSPAEQTPETSTQAGGAAQTAVANHQLATFAGGCFWCMEPVFDKVDGVISTTRAGVQETRLSSRLRRGGRGI